MTGFLVPPSLTRDSRRGSLQLQSGTVSMARTRNSLSENVRDKAVAALNLHLAAAIDLHAQVKQAHWNIRGRQFIGVHELLDTISAQVEDWSDLLAERAGALGGSAHGAIQVAAAQSYLSSYTLTIANVEAHTAAVADAIASFGGRVREAVDEASRGGDPVTADVLTEIARAADQALWKLEAHQDPSDDDAPRSPRAVS